MPPIPSRRSVSDRSTTRHPSECRPGPTFLRWHPLCFNCPHSASAILSLSGVLFAQRRVPRCGIGDDGCDVPSPDLLALIARLVEEEEVASVYFNGVEPTDGQPVVPDEAGWRPALSVSVDDQQGQAVVVSALEAFAEPQALDATVPRASFKVMKYTVQTTSVDIDGLMGLPVESPAPDAIEQPKAAPSVDQSEAADQQNEEQKGEPAEGRPTATPAVTSVSAAGSPPLTSRLRGLGRSCASRSCARYGC
jgi:hypothetical protein